MPQYTYKPIFFCKCCKDTILAKEKRKYMSHVDDEQLFAGGGKSEKAITEGDSEELKKKDS